MVAAFKKETVARETAGGKRYEDNKVTMKARKEEEATTGGGNEKNLLPDTIVLSSEFQNIGVKKVLNLLKHFATLLLFSVTLLPLKIFILISMITLKMIYNATSSQDTEQPVNKQPVNKQPVNKQPVVQVKASPIRRRVRKSASLDNLSATTKVPPIRRRAEIRFRKARMKKPNKIKQEEEVTHEKRRVHLHNNATLQPSQRCISQTTVSSSNCWTPEPSPVMVRVYCPSDTDTISTMSSLQSIYSKPSNKRNLRSSLSLSRKRMKQMLLPCMFRTYAHDDDVYNNAAIRVPMPSAGPPRPQRTVSSTSESMTTISRPIKSKQPQVQPRRRRRSSSLNIHPSSQPFFDNTSATSTYDFIDDINSSMVFSSTSSEFTPVAEVERCRRSPTRSVFLFVYHSWCFSVLLMLPAVVHLLLGVKSISEYEELVLENWRSIPSLHQLCEEVQEIFQVWRENLISSITDQLWKDEKVTVNTTNPKRVPESGVATHRESTSTSNIYVLKFLQSYFRMTHSCVGYIVKILLVHPYTRLLVYPLYPLYVYVRNFGPLMWTIVNLLCLMLIHLCVLLTSQICFLLSIPMLCFNTIYSNLFSHNFNLICSQLFCIREMGKSGKKSYVDGKERLDVEGEDEKVCKESLQSMYKNWSSQKGENSSSVTTPPLADPSLEKLKSKKEVAVSLLKPFEVDSSDSYSDWDTFSSRSGFFRNRNQDSTTSNIPSDPSNIQHKQPDPDYMIIINKIKEEKVKQIEEKLTLKKDTETVGTS